LENNFKITHECNGIDIHESLKKKTKYPTIAYTDANSPGVH